MLASALRGSIGSKGGRSRHLGGNNCAGVLYDRVPVLGPGKADTCTGHASRGVAWCGDRDHDAVITSQRVCMLKLGYGPVVFGISCK